MENDANWFTKYDTSFEVKNYIEGVDELAELLDVQPITLTNGVCLRSKSGNYYSLTELLVAHIELMKKTLEKNNDNES